MSKKYSAKFCLLGYGFHPTEEGVTLSLQRGEDGLKQVLVTLYRFILNALAIMCCAKECGRLLRRSNAGHIWMKPMANQLFSSICERTGDGGKDEIKVLTDAGYCNDDDD